MQEVSMRGSGKNGDVRFHLLTPAGRVCALCEAGALSPDDATLLTSGRPLLATDEAHCMVENVVGTFSLPLSVVPQFPVNGKEYAVPLVTEEPSVVAAMSAAAKVARLAGGFESTSGRPCMVGQIHLVGVRDPERAAGVILENRGGILERLNSLHRRMAERGGGALEISVRILDRGALAVHVVVDTRDAMGANLVSRMCEDAAPLVEEISGGRALMRILSNLCDSALVSARIVVPEEQLGHRGLPGAEVRDRIVAASEIAESDPYRAATHNKGVMNGIDAVALATGNDWRSVEAGAHARAASGGRYRPLSIWRTGEGGALEGHIEIPLKVGTVGAQISGSRGAALSLRLLGVTSASELAAVMAAVGLAQNFAALRMLVCGGVSEGHLRLHARSVALAAGAGPEEAGAVARVLGGEKEVKVWRAKEILQELRRTGSGSERPRER